MVCLSAVRKFFAVAVLDAVGYFPQYLFDSLDDLKYLGLEASDLDIANVLAHQSCKFVAVVLYLQLAVER